MSHDVWVSNRNTLRAQNVKSRVISCKFAVFNSNRVLSIFFDSCSINNSMRRLTFIFTAICSAAFRSATALFAQVEAEWAVRLSNRKKSRKLIYQITNKREIISEECIMRKFVISSLVTSLIILTGSILSAQTVWTKYEGNPVLPKGPAGSWDDADVFFPEVILDGSTFKMWYGGYGGTRQRIGYAESSDGITWTKHASNPVLDVGPPGSWDDQEVVPGAVVFDGSSYKMWYWGNGNFRTGYATSPDGITWTKHASNPVMDLGPSGAWDSEGVGGNSVLFNGSMYELWYNGLMQPIFQIGYATSFDGIDWTKYETNPVLDLSEEAGDWDDADVDVAIGAVLFDGTTYRMWYDSFDGANSASIGYATAPKDPITGIADEGVVPEKYELSQNYPNPFNPETVIRYSLPKAEEVSLVVYNLIGEEVAHLIAERKPAGSYTVKWDASNFASGIYFYRLQAGDFAQTRKMVLLK